MTADLTWIIAVLTLGIPVLIVVMLVPTTLKPRKREDGKRRTVVEDISERQIQVANIENEQEFDSAIIQPLAKIIEVLPNLEA